MLSRTSLTGLPAALSLAFLLACGGRSEQAGTPGPKVYVGGTQSLPINVPGYWVDNTWIGLQQTPDSGGWVETMVVSGGDVYTAGWSTSPTGVNVGYWRNRSWVGLTPPGGMDAGEIHALAVSGGEVYAAGEVYPSSNNVETTSGFWKNGQWTALKVPSGARSAVFSMTISNGVIYIGGRILQNGTSEPGYWRDGTWVGLRGPDGPILGFVSSLAVAGSDVYATGQSTLGPGYWKNGTWIPLSPSGDSRTIAVADGNVIVGGQLRDGSSEDGGMPGYWKNGTWVGLPLPAGAYSGDTSSVAVWGNEVYVSGYAYSHPTSGQIPASQAGYWRNGTWVSLSQARANNLDYAHTIVLAR